MPTLEIFTIGGGEYIVNVLNAVAAWTNLGGYKGLIQVVMVMGLTMALLVLAFNNDWRTWLNWFLQVTLMYLCLMVPRVDVVVTDRINPSLAPAAIDNVPLGLGVMASFTSQIGDYLVRSAELVFGLPGDLDYSRNGMIYGSRLMQATQTLRINDPEFGANVDEHMRQCVFYDVLLGRKSLDGIAKADDLWASLGPGSPARSQKFLTRDAATGTVTSDIITCQQAYTNLNGQWSAMIDSLSGVFGRQLYPKQTDALARAKLYADLPVAYQYLTGASKSASDILKQALVVNAFGQAMHTMTGSSGAGAVDVYAATRAEIQTENTYRSISYSAMKWVPILNVVLTVVFYALFPVIFPLFLMPRTGVVALKGYVTGFFYLAAWGPLYVVLHMIMMFKAAEDVAAAGAAGAGGMSLASFAGISAVSDDIGVLAGYLVGAIPFLAAGIARGALAISTQATSYLSPSQNASEEAAREATTGNIALGNLSYDNFTYNTRQGNAWNVAGGYTGGAFGMTTRQGDGSLTSSYPSSTVVDQSGAISRMDYTPQLSDAVSAEMSQSAVDSFARSSSLANTASSSFSAANTQASEFRRALSSGTTLERSFGAEDRNTVSNTVSMLNQAADTLQSRFGLSRETAENAVSELFHNSQLSTSLGGSIGLKALGTGGGLNGSIGSTTGVGVRSGESSTVGASNNLSAAKEYLENVARSQNWGDSRDSFDRAVQNSSNSDIVTRSNSVSSSYTEASSVAREARQAYEEGQRYEEAARLAESQSFSGSTNLSQEFVDFVLSEQGKNQGMWQHAWNPTRGLPQTPEEEADRQAWIEKFADSQADRIRAGVEGELDRPTPAGITGPSVSTQAGVRKLATGDMGDIDGMSVPQGAGVQSRDDIEARREERASAVEQGGAYVDGRLDRREEALKRPTSNLSRNPAETLERAKDAAKPKESFIDRINPFD